MTTYKIGQRANKVRSEIIRIDLPDFATPQEAFDFIQDELWDWNLNTYFVTPVER